MSVKIAAFHVENVKRIKAVEYSPESTGLTVIGGKNGQGKTSIIDALAWALGGAKLAPTDPARDGAITPPEIDIKLSNGIRVQRKGKNAALIVTDETGAKAGQTLLDAFVSEFALNLPKFMNATAKDKAETLLRVIGVGDKLYEYERVEKRLYDERHSVRRDVERKTKYAEELPDYPCAPHEKVDVVALSRKLRDAHAANMEAQKLRQNVTDLKREGEMLAAEVEQLEAKLADAKLRLAGLRERYADAKKTAVEASEIDTASIEAEIESAETVNKEVEANAEKERAITEATAQKALYDALTARIERTRADRLALLENANMPLAGLSVEGGELIYSGHAWDCMSGSEQLRVAASIVKRLNPECGFVFVDRLEVLDAETLREFAEWAKTENLQVIGTRVSTGSECSIIIEDGSILEES